MMQEELEHELVAREYCNYAKEHNNQYEDLGNWLEDMLDFDKLSSQKDCRRMYYQVIGVERYINSFEDNYCNTDNVMKAIEDAKKEITEKLWYFFELEEGDKYEKVSDGIFRRKCNC